MNDTLKLLRYNTGTDKKVFIKFRNSVSAVIFNATIVAYSGSAVADLVSVYKNQYIIDPQTHIYQHNISAIQTINSKGNTVEKKSVIKYLDELPKPLKDNYLRNHGELPPVIIEQHIDELVSLVYEFETEYVNKYIKKKEYDKYLQYVKIGPTPRCVIAPYFMFKDSYTDADITKWFKINRTSAEKFIKFNHTHGNYSVGVQIVLDKEILERDIFINNIKKYYSDLNAEFAFLWIDEFNSFNATKEQQNKFKELLVTLSEIGLKPIMSYGGYDSILLCNKDIPYHLYGVSQSVGYGESRAITPVGGGLPVNKYYFPPLHCRLNMAEVSSILMKKGYFSTDNKSDAAEKFYNNICSCKQCKTVIKNNIDNFNLYNDSIPFKIRNNITRNRPTAEATLIAAIHFMHAKILEWENVEKYSFDNLAAKLIKDYEDYAPNRKASIRAWCDLYAKK